MIADDLFAGAGGWDLGAERHGITARGIELARAPRATRSAAGMPTLHDDAWTYEPDGLATGLIASPPCQTFSRAGRGSGRAALITVHDALSLGVYRDRLALRDLGREVGDERTALVLLPMHFATQYDYRWLAWEQVPAVLPVWEACATILRELGLSVWTGLVHAEQYGLPQARIRAVLLASHGQVLPPMPTHSRYYARTPSKLDPGTKRWITMGDALTHGLSAVHGACEECGDDDPTEGYIYCSDCLWDNPMAAAAVWTPTFFTQTGTPVDEAWPWKRPSTTVAGRGRVSNPGSTANRFQPEVTKSRNDGVVITVQEAGILQGFPPAFPWQGTKTEQFQQVGNAFPPLLATAMLGALLPEQAINREGASTA